MFYWDFAAIVPQGWFAHHHATARTQIYFKRNGTGALVPVHYSGHWPAAIQRQGFEPAPMPLQTCSIVILSIRTGRAFPPVRLE